MSTTPVMTQLDNSSGAPNAPQRIIAETRSTDEQGSCPNAKRRLNMEAVEKLNNADKEHLKSVQKV